MLENLKIKKITETDNLLMVDLTFDGYEPCHFVFCDNVITCFGESIESYT